jgi:DNA-binding response OmpR family regulator
MRKLLRTVRRVPPCLSSPDELRRCGRPREPCVPRLILVIEDEPGIVDFVERGLRAHGFEVISALDGVTGTDLALNEDVDLVVLDMMLPGRSGLEVLAALAESKPALPVIVLTARGGIEDRVAGLDAGAVDYLVKPFSLAELAARVRAQLRMALQAPTTAVRAGDIEVDLLKRTEFDLLVYLLDHRGRVLSREQILRAVWRYDHDPGTNVVDVYVGYLRRKLRRDDREVPISTIRSVGYRLDDGL